MGITTGRTDIATHSKVDKKFFFSSATLMGFFLEKNFDLDSVLFEVTEGRVGGRAAAISILVH